MFCTRWAAGALAALVTMASGGSVHAAPLFSEDFEGYASFPTVVNTYFGVPAGHPTSGTVQERINGGLPLLTEGTKEIWYGARFEDLSAGNGTINALNGDLAVQNYGSINRPDDPNANYTHVGRFEDDAGLAFHLDTTGMGSVVLTFDWRTYNVESGDVVRVGYRSGNPGFGTCAGAGESGCYADLRTGPGAWSSWSALTLSDANPKGNNNSWLHETFALPGDTADLWVAFWLDDGEGDIGKIDNITVTGIPITPVPVPAAAWLLVSALAWMLFGTRHPYRG